jgi:hypothetical protein
MRARNRARRSDRMHSVHTRAPPRAPPRARAPLSARAAQRARAERWLRCRSADVPVRALLPVHAAKGPRPHVPRMRERA